MGCIQAVKSLFAVMNISSLVDFRRFQNATGNKKEFIKLYD
jgi:hypothetical protein